ncbi:MAG TPA: chromosomal replication initiator protein DnaA [Rickettsiales bacterium]|nr:chromosomal replication initiator protein DnaA [Rickettsiales bacterium]
MSSTVLQEMERPRSVEKSQSWERVKGRLQAALGEATFKSWFNSIQYEYCEARQVFFTVPTRFVREWIMSHYADEMLRLWKAEDPSLISVEVRVRQAGTPKPAPQRNTTESPSSTVAAQEAAAPTRELHTAPENAASSNAAIEVSDSSLYVGALLDPRLTFENFVVAKPNELAHAAARRVAENDVVMQGCNPLFLYGGVGLGKTHLMHSIAWHIRRTNPERKVIYLSAEKFMYQFIRALRFKEALAFKEQFRSVDVLMIDDVQFISGKDSTQEEFFHTFNALVDQNKQLIISCDRSPSDLEGMEERIRSRLGWGLVADIHATSYELRLGILQSKVEKMQGIMIPQKVLEFLAHKITSNVRELEGALNRVVAHSTLVGRPVTLENTQEVLHDLLRANDRHITIEDIQKQVANHYNMKVSDMHSARRSRTVARPRQVAMYLAKKLTNKSLPEIGRKFGGKDHTTVMHAVKRVEELCKEEAEFAQDIEMLTRIFCQNS